MHARFYIIASVAVLAEADAEAEKWDPLSGSATFSKGQALSGDGGNTITHRGANTLANHPEHAGSPIDVDKVLNRLKTAPLLDVYSCDDPYGQGPVHRLAFNGSEITETKIGNGDLQTLALSDAGLEVYHDQAIEDTLDQEPSLTSQSVSSATTDDRSSEPTIDSTKDDMMPTTRFMEDLKYLFVAFCILAPLGLWKMVEILIWLFTHIHFS